MSMTALVQQHEANGDLWRVCPLIPGDESRTMFVSREVTDLLFGSWPVAAQRRVGFLRANLDAFVVGETIGLCMRPGKARDDAQMAVLDPPSSGIFDYRSCAPTPGIRIIGMFAGADTFFGLIWVPRSKEWLGRQPLLDRNSREWRDAILRAKREWRRLFLSYGWHVGRIESDYITSNCNPV